MTDYNKPLLDDLAARYDGKPLIIDGYWDFPANNDAREFLAALVRSGLEASMFEEIVWLDSCKVK